MAKTEKVSKKFFRQDAFIVSQTLLGKFLCRKFDEKVKKQRITETECYFGKADSASHAFRKKTARNKVMFKDGGVCYVYLCYGIHNMLNIVTGNRNSPQAVLIRSTEKAIGPGKVAQFFQIDRTFNGKSLLNSKEIWIESDGKAFSHKATKRIGIGYAKPEDQQKLWRFVAK